MLNTGSVPFQDMSVPAMLEQGALAPPVMITLLSLSVVVSGLTETSTRVLVYADKGIVLLGLAIWFD